LALEALQGVEPELGHPLGLALLERDVADDLLVEALLRRVDVVGRAVGPAELVLPEIDAGDGHTQSSRGGQRGDFSYVDSNNSRGPQQSRPGREGGRRPRPGPAGLL